MRLVSSLPSVLLILAAACGRQTTPPGGDAAAGGPVEPYGDPRSYAGDPFAGFLQVRTVGLPAGGGGAADSAVTEPGVDSTAAVSQQGGRWCIQISACSTEEDADRLSGQVVPLTDLECRIDPEGQWWKVRLGAFPTREDAEARLDEVRALGYPDAWIVERAGGD